ncbi:hypothetical protein DEO72_LG4g739 [Vigna unguiculata]|uniref:Uncharacterized protein n=1 Tax=Vigna unguiculata TaxID=3917 RepID=A0A4D6LLW9_VIGUN|nr:hypothetical protein DEO72_LG4g738 [Vigna unguiculata]QCD89790.1 hypothetical protein DEO72_LG4g739 [Vigna unguiculata]
MLYELYDCDECVNDDVLLFGCEHVTVAGKAVTESVNLAQARVTRLGETCRGKPRVSRTLAQAEDTDFERGLVSLRREPLAYARRSEGLECCCGLAQARDLTVGRKVVSLRQARTRLSEPARASQH